MENAKIKEILLVDDEPSMGKVFSAIFEADAGYKLLWVPGGEECLKTIFRRFLGMN